MFIITSGITLITLAGVCAVIYFLRRLAQRIEEVSDAGLNNAGNQIELMESRLGKVDGCVSALTGKISAIEARVSELSVINSRIVELAGNQTELTKSRLGRVDACVTALTGKIGDIKTKVSELSVIDSKIVELAGNQTELMESRLGRVDACVTALTGKIGAIEARISELSVIDSKIVELAGNQTELIRSRLDRADGCVTALTGKIGAIEARISELSVIDSKMVELVGNQTELMESRLGRIDACVTALTGKVGDVEVKISELSVINSRIAELAKDAIYKHYMLLLKDIDGLENETKNALQGDTMTEIRGRIFEQLSKELRFLSSYGGGDASTNLPLRVSLDRAEAQGMSPERIVETINGEMSDVSRHDYVVMVNITWVCELACPYCWHRTGNGTVSIGDDVVKIETDRPAKDWLYAFRNLPPALLDFVGGEPFNYRDWFDLCDKIPRKHKYTVTTNLHSTRLKEFADMVSPTQCIHITGSFHPNGNLTKDEFLKRLNIFRERGYDVSVNLVDYPTTAPVIAQLKNFFEEENGIRTDINPWENPRDLNTLNPETTLSCNAGVKHAFINNNGDVYKCLTNFRYPDRERALMGNVFRGDYRWFTERQTCERYCELYYIVDPKMEHYHYLDVRPAVRDEPERSAI